MVKSRFDKQSHVIWHCQYHIVWVPKYRYKVMHGKVKEEIEQAIRLYCSIKGTIIIELNVQIDHVHLLVKIPPKVSVSELVGILKGKSATRVFSQFPNMKRKPYWGNKFWAQGYCVDTVGVDAEMIRKYVKYQEKKDKDSERGTPSLF